MKVEVIAESPPARAARPEIARDVQEEIRFLMYRLDVLEGWPGSALRDGRIAATAAGLRMLAPGGPSAGGLDYRAAA